MKIINIIILVSCLSLVVTGRHTHTKRHRTMNDLPIDEEFQAQISELVQKQAHCDEFDPKIQAYFQKHQAELKKLSGKDVCFSCVNDQHFDRVVKYCQGHQCNIDVFFRIVGEKSGLDFFSCHNADAQTSDDSQSAGSRPQPNCSDEANHLECFLNLIVSGQTDCTQYDPYLKNLIKLTYNEEHECRATCTEVESKNNWNTVVSKTKQALRAQNLLSENGLNIEDSDGAKFTNKQIFIDAMGPFVKSLTKKRNHMLSCDEKAPTDKVRRRRKFRKYY
jgi:hypothetical protein